MLSFFLKNNNWNESKKNIIHAPKKIILAVGVVKDIPSLKESFRNAIATNHVIKNIVNQTTNNKKE